jgi:hypothetical protein
MPMRPEAMLVIATGAASLGSPGEAVPGSCFSRCSGVLVGLAASGRLRRVNFFRFFTITFFFLMTRIRTCSPEVLLGGSPRVQRGETNGMNPSPWKALPVQEGTQASGKPTTSIKKP